MSNLASFSEKKKRLLFRGFSWPSALAQGRFQAQGGGDHRLPVCCPEGLLAIHAGAERGAFMIEEGLINTREPVGGYVDRSGIAQMRKSQTRPGPVSRVLGQSRTDRIAEHIAEDRKEMAVLLNRKTFETALPHMPMASVVAMVAADMGGHPPLHEWAEGGVGGRLHDQMEMIGHEADGEELEGVFGFCRSEHIEERSVIAILVEDRRATAAAIEHMVGVSGHLSAWNTRNRSSTVCETRAAN